MRPYFPWDWRDFGIIPWGGRYVSNAVAAQFSYLQFAASAPGGYDLVILEIRSESGSLFTRVSTTTNTGVLTSQGVAPLDSAWGPYGNYNVNLADVSTSATTGGALTGTEVAQITTAVPLIWPLILRAGITGAFYAITPNVVNTQLICNVTGLLVPSTAL